jgi:hypothetical protein
MEVKDARNVVSVSRRESSIPSREHAWKTCDSNPLPRMSRRHHYHDRHVKYGRHWLVMSHRCGMQAGLKDNTARSPTGLVHRPNPHETYLTCRSAVVVSH